MTACSRNSTLAFVAEATNIALGTASGHRALRAENGHGAYNLMEDARAEQNLDPQG